MGPFVPSVYSFQKTLGWTSPGLRWSTAFRRRVPWIRQKRLKPELHRKSDAAQQVFRPAENMQPMENGMYARTCRD